MSSKWENGEDTVQVAVPEKLHCLHLAAINMQVVFLAKFPTWEARTSHKLSPGKPTSAVVAGNNGKTSNDFQKLMVALKVFGLSRD